ncbi:MAG TPA: periplasmic heavy metal sensor [Usitatibacter sp.]|nr:periplasmic heavy metal sensor [Usitatibacter sp.]
MKGLAVKLLLAASLLVNVGIAAAVLFPGWKSSATIERALFGMRHEQVPEHLGLDNAQRERWHALEADFIDKLHESGGRIQEHRVALVRALMAEQPDAAAIERERAAIFSLQEAQQRAVIEQLLKEREMLRPAQREALAGLLISQGAEGSPRH